MANEMTVRVSMRTRRISSGETLVDEKFDLSFRSDMSGVGPAPGTVVVPMAGADVSFAALATLGECGMKNNGAFPIDWGLRDVALGRFLPLGTMDPGKGVYLGKLYQFLGEYEEGSGGGTGTGSVVEAYALHLRAVGGASSAFVGGYER